MTILKLKTIYIAWCDHLITSNITLKFILTARTVSSIHLVYLHTFMCEVCTCCSYSAHDVMHTYLQAIKLKFLIHGS